MNKNDDDDNASQWKEYELSSSSIDIALRFKDKLLVVLCEQEYDAEKDNLNSYPKGRHDAFKGLLNGVCDSGSGG